MLLENSNNTEQDILQDPIKEAGLDWNENISLVQWKTPRTARDISSQVKAISHLSEPDLPSQRQLFRKITKGFDEKDYALAEADLRIKQLEARIEQLEPKKRQKVRTSLNSKFVDIEAIRQAQIEAREVEVEGEDSDSSLDSISTGDCIVVQ